MVVSEKTLPDLKKAYAKAIRLNHDTFTFNGAQLLVSYAKYLIEFLEEGFDEVRR